MKDMIYLDNAATTRVKPEVLEAMLPYFSEIYGNASSIHRAGQEARKAIETARRQVAAAIGAQPQEIFFTGGGTEADNWAIEGVLASPKARGRHIITSGIEHHAVLHTCQWMEKQGCRVDYLPVDGDGLVDPAAVEAAIGEDTALITIMLANNEIGSIQPIREIGAIAKAHGIPLHTDAVQAVGAIPVDVEDLQVDLLSLSAHKFYGPKGVGVLYVRKGMALANFQHGGAQERGKRAGTENLPGIVGLGKAIEMATCDIPGHAARLIGLRDRLIQGILRRIPEVRLNGHPTLRLPGNVNVSVAYVEGEALLLRLDLAGIEASSGSACTSGALDPSHVLLAIGLPHEVAHGSLRLTLGDCNTEWEVDAVLDTLPEIVQKLREMSPMYEDAMAERK